MSFLLCCLITITPKSGGNAMLFRFAHSIDIKSSWRTLTDTAVIKLPRNVNSNDESGYSSAAKLDDLIHRGDAVNIQCGYDYNLRTVFDGFVTSVSPKWPVEIMCDDKMFKLKQQQVKPKQFNSQSTSIQDVLDYCNIPADFNLKVISDIEIGPFKITLNETTVAKVLDKLRHNYFIYAFMRDGSLTIGEPYPLEAQEPILFGFGQNIIKHDLVYRLKEDILLKVKATSWQRTGKKIQVIVGDVNEGSEEHSLEYYNLNAKQLQGAARRGLDRLKYTGYKGKLTAFGLPAISHGKVAGIVKGDNNEKSGNYFVDGVNTVWGMNGFRQHVELGPVTA